VSLQSLVAIPGATGVGAAGAIRFRLVSYNVLAELYATKQVHSHFTVLQHHDWPFVSEYYRDVRLEQW
jgi:mRNA deadenylase 3'-5' endonuclease subunit Ccr4